MDYSTRCGGQSGQQRGGPLFDDCGRVVGVNTASAAEGIQGVSLASRITEAIPHLESKGVRLQKVNDACSPASDGGISELDPEARQEADAARQEASKASFISLIILGISVLSLAIVLVLPKPRQKVAKVIEHVSQYLPSLPLPRSAKNHTSKHTALVLAGFDTFEKKLRILIPQLGTSKAQGGYVLGRHPALVDHVVEDTNTSHRHARITVEDGECRIEDLNSTNGTQVNGHELTTFVPTPIAPGDVICFGAIQLQASSGG